MIKNMWSSSAERQLRLNIRANFIQNQNIGIFLAMVKTNIDISFIWQYRNYLANELVDLSFIYLEFKLREKCWFWKKNCILTFKCNFYTPFDAVFLCKTGLNALFAIFPCLWFQWGLLSFIKRLYVFKHVGNCFKFEFLNQRTGSIWGSIHLSWKSNSSIPTILGWNLWTVNHRVSIDKAK